MILDATRCDFDVFEVTVETLTLGTVSETAQIA